MTIVLAVLFSLVCVGVGFAVGYRHGLLTAAVRDMATRIRK